jgi:hypothetical protein
VKTSRAFLTVGTALFLGSTILVFFLTADLFHPSLDEGIYLEGGHRVLLGQAPYKDFFAYTGPLIYWVQAFLEKLFGADMRMLRLSTGLSVGLTCLGTFWMAERFVGWKVGAATALVFLGMRMPSFQHFTVSHRWLSTSLMTMSIAIALDAVRAERSRWPWFAAGACAAAAAWATPTYLIPLAVLIVWAALGRERGRSLAFLTVGAFLVSAPAIFWLAQHGALLPMFDKLVWASRQYSTANRVPFGYYPAGFQTVKSAEGPVNLAIAWVKDARMMIPVVLIPLALIIGFVQLYRGVWKGASALLVWLALAMVLTTWPRWDVNLLIGVTPPCFVLLAIWIEERIAAASRPLQAGILVVYVAAMTLSFAYAVQLFSIVGSFNYFPTRVGLLRNIEEDGDAYAALEQRVPEGENVFVFPYMPSMGFMLKTSNPTSYAYLQPGMMSPFDEAATLEELEAKPPKLILRQYLPDEQVFSVWPNSDRSEMRFPAIEKFIGERYTEVDKVNSPHFSITVLERR